MISPIEIEYRDCSPKDPTINNYLNELSFVPTFLQDIVAMESKIVFFNGPITDTEVIKHSSGEHYGVDWTDVPGAYENRTIFLRTDPTIPVLFSLEEKRSVMIHEVSHAIDDIVGEFIGGYGHDSSGGALRKLSCRTKSHQIFNGTPQYGRLSGIAQDIERSEMFAQTLEGHFLSVGFKEQVKFWYKNSAFLTFRKFLKEAKRKYKSFQ